MIFVRLSLRTGDHPAFCGEDMDPDPSHTWLRKSMPSACSIESVRGMIKVVRFTSRLSNDGN